MGRTRVRAHYRRTGPKGATLFEIVCFLLLILFLFGVMT